MPYSDPQSTHDPTTGQIIPASWGDVVRDGLEYLARNFPHCSLQETTAQSVASGAITNLTSNEEDSDIGGMHSTSTNTERITIPSGEGGLYRIAAVVEFASGGTGRRVLLFIVNGSSNYDVCAVMPVTSGFGTVINGSRNIVLAAGDYVTCAVLHDQGVNLNVNMRNFLAEWRAVA